MNKILIYGEVFSEPKLSHTTYGINFLSFNMKINRLSDSSDVLNCIIPEEIANDIYVGKKIGIDGEIRTCNKVVACKNFMLVQVLVNHILEYQKKDANIVEIEGNICKTPIFRVTPLGREIADLIVASNRRMNWKSDYIPCVTWGVNARRCVNIPVGTKVKITGRFQSREYIKNLDDGTQEVRTAYEVSASRIEVIKEESKEGA